MAGKSFGQILSSILLIVPTVQQGVLASDSYLPMESQAGITTRQHVYVVGSDPNGRAVMGKALTRLGYVSSDRSEVDHDPRLLPKVGRRAINSGSYSYTEISTPQDDLDGLSSIVTPSSDYIIIHRGHNQTAFSSESKGESLELSFAEAEALGKQAEKWVALCEFLGLGYSTVERLKLWEFP